MPTRAATSSALRDCAVRTLLVCLVCLAVADGESLAGQPAAGHSFLTAATWTGSAYSHHAGGIICWLSGEDGSLRVEVSDTAAASFAEASNGETNPLDKLEPLLTRTGDGWTMILGPDDTGTLNAWGREWRQVPPGLAQVVRLVTVSLHDYPDRRPEFDFAPSAGPPCRWSEIPRPSFLGARVLSGQCGSSWHFQLPSLDLENDGDVARMDFRGRMVARGRGTGGDGEIISLEWIPTSGADETALVITSSRRPGTLRLDPPRELAVKTPEPEVFLPLWPLSQFLETR